jgi:alpha-1,2-glucosyltransferase
MRTHRANSCIYVGNVSHLGRAIQRFMILLPLKRVQVRNWKLKIYFTKDLSGDLLQTFITVSSILSDILPSFIPYTLLLFSFGAFVAWNGGIVLGETPFGTSFRFIFISDCRSRSGDKSNHALTLHVPQMYYFVAFCTLLGWPVLISGRSGMSGLVREVSWRMFGSRRLALFRVFANTK